MPLNACEYIVLSKKQETPTTVTLFLAKEDGSIPVFNPGQYLTVYFPDLSQTLGKQYSISSAPCEQKLAITVKAIGRFSNRICSLRPGERVLASKPQGNFSVTQGRRAVMLAGGMGITPFRSMIVEAASNTSMNAIWLLYSAKYSGDIPFAQEFFRLSARYSFFSVKWFVTKESGSRKEIHYRRIQLSDALQSLNANSQTEFLISGSLSFVLALRKVLIKIGVSSDAILTEAYG